MKRIILLFGITIICFSCITIKPHLSGDGSSLLTNNDSLSIDPFVLDSSFIFHNYSKKENIRFQIIEARNLEILLKQKPVNWIMIGSSWCPVSDYEFKKSSNVIKEFPEDSIQFIYINQDFNLKELRKMIMASSFREVPYLLNIQKYGTDESEKQKLFYRDLQWPLDSNFGKSGGVPVMFLARRDTSMVFIGGYKDSNADTITKYTGLKKIVSRENNN